MWCAMVQERAARIILAPPGSSAHHLQPRALRRALQHVDELQAADAVDAERGEEVDAHERGLRVDAG